MPSSRDDDAVCGVSFMPLYNEHPRNYRSIQALGKIKEKIKKKLDCKVRSRCLTQENSLSDVKYPNSIRLYYLT